MKSVLTTTALWCLFVIGLVACIGSGFVLHDHMQQQISTYSGTALALVTGFFVFRKEPIKSWLATRPVLWFLFLFNLTAAVCVGILVSGPQRIMAVVGLGLVSLGAGGGLLKSKKPSADSAAASQAQA